MQIAREALVNAGIAYGMLIPTLVDPHDDLGEAIEAVFTQAADDMAATGFANMCPVASVAAEVADTIEELRTTTAAVFDGWLDGGTAYFVERDVPHAAARDVTVALVGALEGALRPRIARCAAPNRCWWRASAGACVPRAAAT